MHTFSTFRHFVLFKKNCLKMYLQMFVYFNQKKNFLKNVDFRDVKFMLSIIRHLEYFRHFEKYQNLRLWFIKMRSTN